MAAARVFWVVPGVPGARQGAGAGTFVLLAGRGAGAEIACVGGALGVPLRRVRRGRPCRRIEAGERR